MRIGRCWCYESCLVELWHTVWRKAQGLIVCAGDALHSGRQDHQL